MTGPEPEYDKIISGYKVFHHQHPFEMKYNKARLPELQVAYETWGKLNETKSNAVMIQAGLSASSHAKSHRVWSLLFYTRIPPSPAIPILTYFSPCMILNVKSFWKICKHLWMLHVILFIFPFLLFRFESIMYSSFFGALENQKKEKGVVDMCICYERKKTPYINIHYLHIDLKRFVVHNHASLLLETTDQC